jgi:hypothetical protein
LANKQYISIIRLFDHCGISTDDFSLSRAKKQLQAEFGIAQGGFIEVEGLTYTRHDVFEEIEQPDFAQRLIFHKQIWKSPEILNLLENNSADLVAIHVEFKPFLGNKEFDEFFSPYFVGPFTYLSRNFLTENKLRDIGTLLAYEDFLQPSEREEAFRSIRIYLDENVRILRNVNKDNYEMMRPKFAHWIETDWYLFFNYLPHEFYEIKNDITTFIINIGVAVQKKHRKDCRAMSEQLISLNDTPENLRSIIVSNHGVYTEASSSSGSGWGRNIFWAIWIVFMIIRAASGGCGSSGSSSYDFNNYKPTYEPFKISDSTFKILADSSTRIMHDSSFKKTIDSIIKKSRKK